MSGEACPAARRCSSARRTEGLCGKGQLVVLSPGMLVLATACVTGASGLTRSTAGSTNCASGQRVAREKPAALPGPGHRGQRRRPQQSRLRPSLSARAPLSGTSMGRRGETTYFDRMPIGLCGICLGVLKVKPVLGRFRSTGRGFDSAGFAVNGPATIPSPVSTRAWPRDPALEPSRGISFLAWKFRGLRPRTTIGDVVASVSTTLDPLASVPTTLRCNMKCCCSSFRLPLFAVALQTLDLAKGVPCDNTLLCERQLTFETATSSSLSGTLRTLPPPPTRRPGTESEEAMPALGPGPG